MSLGYFASWLGTVLVYIDDAHRAGAGVGHQDGAIAEAGDAQDGR